MPARFSSPRFVGREGSFARLATVLDAASDGHATTLLIAGSGGFGTSRFLTEAESRLASLAVPFVVLRARAVPAGADEPYAPVVRAARPLLAEVPDDELAELVSTGAEDIVRLLPELGRRLAPLGLLPARPTIASPERRQARVLEAILGVLSRVGERRPVALILEDLHHADAATRELVRFLARISRGQRLALIATWQPDELTRAHPLSAALAGIAESTRPPERIEIGALDRGELAALIEQIEGERPSASELVLVAERSAGSPLVAEELVAARRELSGASLTGTLEDLVIRRLALRTPECRRVLRLLAPARRPLTHKQLVEVAAAYEIERDGLTPRSTSAPRHGHGVLDADLVAGIAEGVEHGFLVEAADGTVDFRHELIGRAIEADILPLARSRHHLAIAIGLGDTPVAAAHHWLAAHESVRARPAALDAARRAQRVHAPQDELYHLEIALALSGAEGSVAAAGGGGPGSSTAGRVVRQPEDATGTAMPDDDSTTGLHVRAAEAAFAAGRPHRAVAFVEAAIARFESRPDRLALARLHDRLGRYRRAAGDHVGAVRAHRRAVELIPREPSVDGALLLASLAQVRMLEGTFSEAERDAREAIRMARECGQAGRRVELHATTTLAVSLGWGNEPEAGVALLQNARSMALELNDVDELFRVYANLTTVLDLLGRRTEAVEVAYEGIEAARRAGLEAVYGNFLRGNAAESLFLLGRWSESRALSATALEWSPAGVAFVNSVSNLAIVEIETGAGELAGRLLGRLLLELETVRDPQHAVPVYRAAASYARWNGDLADARRAVDRGWELVRATEDWVLMARTAATVAEVDAAVAAESTERRDFAALATARERTAATVAAALSAVQRSAVGATIGSRRDADAHLATAAAYQGRLNGRDDPRTWRALAATWTEQSNPYEVARARWREAEAILASGAGRAARRPALKPLAEAATIGLELGARPLLRELRELSRRALLPLPPAVDLALSADGAPLPVLTSEAAGTNGTGESEVVRTVVGVPAPARKDTFGLSAREREVLGLIAEGRTNREIGERLFISQKTVGVHVGNILAKLRVSGRVEAAAVAIRLGLNERPSR